MGCRHDLDYRHLEVVRIQDQRVQRRARGVQVRLPGHDTDNIAVIHCLTGRGRTAALTACVLAWLGEFTSPLEALDYVSARKNIPVDHLTIPSQRRYVQYFANTLDGVRPSSQPLLLRRIILNTVSRSRCRVYVCQVLPLLKTV